MAYASGRVWEWRDGWTQPAQPNPPPARSSAALAYHPGLQAAVLYGGEGRADCWTWNGTTWTQLAANAAPGVRAGAAMAYDEAAGRLLLYGGASGAQGTWAMVGSAWTQLATNADPGERTAPNFVYDDTGVLLFGGAGSTEDSFWRLQGGTWQQLSVGRPAVRWNQQWAFDPLRQCVVLFGGSPEPTGGWPRLADTWTFDGSWRRHATPVAPPGRAFGACAWSAVDNAVLLFGGSDQTAFGDTWLWNGVTWSQRITGLAPAPRQGHVLAADPAGGVLLFGGYFGTTVFGDQWHWNSAGWTQRLGILQPGARYAAVADFDPLRRKVVMVGGRSPTPLTDAYEWDGSQWSQIPSPLAAGESALRVNNGGLLTTSQLTDWPTGVVNFGSGCALGLAPQLASVQQPRLGTVDFALVTSTLAGPAPTLLAVGFAPQSLPLGGGCALLVDQVVATVTGVASASGELRVPLPIPNDRSLAGVQLRAQSAVIDPPRSAFGGLTLTGGLQVVIGD